MQGNRRRGKQVGIQVSEAVLGRKGGRQSKETEIGGDRESDREAVSRRVKVFMFGRGRGV